MKLSKWWLFIQRRAHVVFPAAASLVALLILTCPLYPEPLAFLSEIPFARFSMFWVFSVCMVMSWAGRTPRPAFVALVTEGISVILGVLYCVVCALTTGLPAPVSDLVLSCLAGAVLGMLAGTWILYVLSIYCERGPRR